MEFGGNMKKIVDIVIAIFILIGVVFGISIFRYHVNTGEAAKHWEQGNIKDKNGDYDGAIEEYTIAIKINPEYVPAYACRASSESTLNKNKEAIRDCDSVIWYSSKSIIMNKFFSFIAQIKDESIWVKSLESEREIEKVILAPVYLMRGQIKRKMKEYKGAKADFYKSIQLSSDNAIAYGSLIGMELDADDSKGAAADIEKAIVLDPKNTKYYVIRSEVKSKMGDKEGARQDLDDALKIKPDAAIYNDRADMKNTSGDYDGAMKDINLAIKIDPEQAFFYCTRGEVENNMVRYGNALEDFNKAIMLESKDGYIYYYRAMAKDKLNDRNGAIEDLKKAVELGYEKANEKIKEIQGK